MFSTSNENRIWKLQGTVIIVYLVCLIKQALWLNLTSSGSMYHTKAIKTEYVFML